MEGYGEARLPALSLFYPTARRSRTEAVGDWGRPGRPQIVFFPPVLRGVAAQNRREESFLEGHPEGTRSLQTSRCRKQKP